MARTLLRRGTGGRTRTDTSRGHLILSQARLPFHHTGLLTGIIVHNDSYYKHIFANVSVNVCLHNIQYSLRSFGQKSQTPVFWRNFRHASLNLLEIEQLFLRKFALPGENFAQNPNISTFVRSSLRIIQHISILCKIWFECFCLHIKILSCYTLVVNLMH